MSHPSQAVRPRGAFHVNGNDRELAIRDFVPSRSTRQLGQRVDEALLARIELVVFNEKRCKGRFRTVRSVLEDAVRMWLAKHEETLRCEADSDLSNTHADDMGK
jgi:hypothetical protein